MGHTEDCDSRRCHGECVHFADLEERGMGECQECEEEFSLDANSTTCPNCGEYHGCDSAEPSYREDFHSDG